MRVTWSLKNLKIKILKIKVRVKIVVKSCAQPDILLGMMAAPMSMPTQELVVYTCIIVRIADQGVSRVGSIKLYIVGKKALIKQIQTLLLTLALLLLPPQFLLLQCSN